MWADWVEGSASLANIGTLLVASVFSNIISVAPPERQTESGSCSESYAFKHDVRGQTLSVFMSQGQVCQVAELVALFRRDRLDFASNESNVVCDGAPRIWRRECLKPPLASMPERGCGGDGAMSSPVDR